MGFNTNITICNDNLSDYARNPERFIRVIEENYNRGGDTWGITVLPTFHADGTQLVAAGHNFATLLHTTHYVGSHHTEDGQLNILRNWAASLGFELHRKRGAGGSTTTQGEQPHD